MLGKMSLLLGIMIASLPAYADRCPAEYAAPKEIFQLSLGDLVVPIKPAECTQVLTNRNLQDPGYTYPNLYIEKKLGQITLLKWNLTNLFGDNNGYYLISSWTGADPADPNPWTAETCPNDTNMMGGEDYNCTGDDPRTKGLPFKMLIRGSNPIYVSFEVGPIDKDLMAWTTPTQKAKFCIQNEITKKCTEIPCEGDFCLKRCLDGKSTCENPYKYQYDAYSYTEADKGTLASISAPMDFNNGLFQKYRVNPEPLTTTLCMDHIPSIQCQGCADLYYSFDIHHAPLGTSGNIADIAKYCPLDSGFVGVAEFQTRVSPGSWGEVEGHGIRLRRQILDQTNLKAFAFVDHPGADNIELGFGKEPIWLDENALRYDPNDPQKKYKLTEAITVAPQGEEKLVRGWSWNSEILHEVGYPVENAGVWRAGPQTPLGAMVFGPYLQNLMPGTYTARFELSVSTAGLNVAEDEQLAYVDVFDAKSQTTLASKVLQLDSFLKDDFRQEHRLTFYNPSNSSLEFRISHKGKAFLSFYNVDLLEHESAGKWLAETDSSLGHAVGYPISGGWRADTSTPAGHMVYGPYINILRGIGMGEFSLRLMTWPSDDQAVLATIEVGERFNNQSTVLSRRELKRGDFTRTGLWHTFTLPFRMPESPDSGKPLELRVYHHGKATVDVEYVTLWR